MNRGKGEKIRRFEKKNVNERMKAKFLNKYIYLLRKRIREEAVSGKRGRKVESNLRKERTRERKK